MNLRSKSQRVNFIYTKEMSISNGHGIVTWGCSTYKLCSSVGKHKEVTIHLFLLVVQQQNCQCPPHWCEQTHAGDDEKADAASSALENLSSNLMMKENNACNHENCNNRNGDSGSIKMPNIDLYYSLI